MIGIRQIVLICTLIALIPLSLEAQSRFPSNSDALDDNTSGLTDADQVVQKPAGKPPTPRHTGIKALVKDLGADITHIPSKQNLFWAGIGGGLALAAHPFDDNVNEALVGSDFADKFFKPGEVLGELPTLLSIATLTYAVGRIKDQPRVSHMGMDLIQALAISELITQSLKYAT